MSHPTSNPDSSSSSSSTEVISLANTPATGTLIDLDDVNNHPTPLLAAHNSLCPFPNSNLKDTCPHCATFKWLDPGPGNLVRGPPEYWPVYPTPPGTVQDEMPRLVDPLPEQDYGPRQSPELNPQDSIIAAAKTIRKIDEGRICQANEELSTLLVAAGFLSIIQAVFIVASYYRVQSDPAEITVQLLLRISQQLANSSIAGVPELATFSPAVSSTRIPGFWCYGLIVSVITGSFGILFKQWLRESLIDETSAEVYLRVRFFRFEGLKTWRVFELVTILPLMLQLSVLLFFLGLKELFSLDERVNGTVIALVYGWAALMVVFTLAPLTSPQCPWKTPLLNHPFRCIRGFLWKSYVQFQEWRHDGYEMNWKWQPGSWFSEATTWLREGFASASEAVGNFKEYVDTFMTAAKEFIIPTEDFLYSPPRRLEEDALADDKQTDVIHLFRTYELVRTDEHLLLVIGALWDTEYSLAATVGCLEGVRQYRLANHNDDPKQWPIGRPSSYGPSLVPSLVPLLIDKVQRYVSWSGTTTKDLVTALHFLLDSYNEKYSDVQILWPLIGGMLLDYHFTPVTMRAYMNRWEAIREIPRFPQLSQPQSKMMIANIFNTIPVLIKEYINRGGSIQSPMFPRLPRSEQDVLDKQTHAPGILLDVMLSAIHYADIADLKTQSDLFSQTLSEFTKAVHLMTTTNANVAVSLDLSIRRLNYLCHKIPPLTDDCALLTKELEHQLLQHYLNNSRKDISSRRQWQRNLGITPHWRQILERDGLLVVVDGVNEEASGFEGRRR
ncbi:hypothetical protein QCA50_008953 [Cerrena zonata]|uniref:DUF6535 domain-containing protein n=1 Tax=Cerrena zonata TaxID=2478898 RepID=A0AAW0G2L5_9APHY